MRCLVGSAVVERRIDGVILVWCACNLLIFSRGRELALDGVAPVVYPCKLTLFAKGPYE